MAHFTGSCLCGQVSYSVEGAPIFMGVCHCKDCQRETGSAFVPVAVFPEAAMKLKGSTKSYASKGQSGQLVHRSFCPECGSTLMARADARPGMVALTTGPMDDTSAFKPAVEIFCASAQPWVELGGGMQKFPDMPGPPE